MTLFLLVEFIRESEEPIKGFKNKQNLEPSVKIMAKYVLSVFVIRMHQANTNWIHKINIHFLVQPSISFEFSYLIVKGPTKSYFTHFSCRVIVLFNTVLCRSVFPRVSSGKPVFRLSVLSVLFFEHSHKKRKDSLETRAALLIFSPELEIFEVAVQSIHQNSKKWRLLLGTAQ